jgi:murein L,D-transpeptidase YcbB/YkuD
MSIIRRAVTVLFRRALSGWPCLVAVLGPVACRRSGDRIGQEIHNITTAERPPAYLQGARWKLLRQIYQDRQYRPLWVGVHPLPERTKELIANLCDAEREGLRPADYHLAELRRTLEQLRPSLERQRPEAFAVLDLELTRRFLDYGADLLAGRLDPKVVSSEWYIRARRSAIDGTLRGAVQGEEFPGMLAPLRPHQPEYAELVKALAAYREILRQGGWPHVPGHTRLRRGDRGHRVAVLRRRLRITGDLAGWAGRKPIYNRAVAKAVARFQARHGIPSNGVVGAATLAALNVPVRVRVRQIQLNLERYRWLPAEFGPRYIYVNIPDYQLYAYDRGEPVLKMRVVVGDDYKNATPVFADLMTFVVFRPYWYVPQRILVREILPRIRKKRSHLVWRQFQVVDAKREWLVLNPRRINWSRVDLTRIRVREKPGRTNHLGLVKFMFPNQFAVYLHDTPTRKMFNRRTRTLSHGCVWVERPVELADYVLAGQGDWNEMKVRQAMVTAHPVGQKESADGNSVTLVQPVPVYLVYLTAFVRDGALNFRRDPYGKDREAIARLGKLSPSDPGLCEALQKLLGD